MRLELILENKETTIICNYEPFIRQQVYEAIPKKEHPSIFGNEIANRIPTEFKLFTFSDLTGKKLELKNNMLQFSGNLSIVFSSYFESAIIKLFDYFVKKKHLTIKDKLFKIISFRLYEEPKITKTYYVIKTLSPICAYKINRKNKTNFSVFYLSPWDDEFNKFIKATLLYKYKIIHGHELNENEVNFNISPLDVSEGKHNILSKYNKNLPKDVTAKVWNGYFYIIGDTRLINIAYTSGIGKNSSLGYGLFNIL